MLQLTYQLVENFNIVKRGNEIMKDVYETIKKDIGEIFFYSYNGILAITFWGITILYLCNYINLSNEFIGMVSLGSLCLTISTIDKKWVWINRLMLVTAIITFIINDNIKLNSEIDTNLILLISLYALFISNTFNEIKYKRFIKRKKVVKSFFEITERRLNNLKDQKYIKDDILERNGERDKLIETLRELEKDGEFLEENIERYRDDIKSIIEDLEV